MAHGIRFELTLQTAVAQTGPAAAYSFNQGGGSFAVDASGNSNTATVVGATWIATGKFGNALSFDGTTSSVLVDNTPSLQSATTAITVSAWIRPSGTSQPASSVIQQANANNFLSYAIGQSGSNAGRLSGYLRVNNTIYTTAVAKAMNDQTWYYVVLKWQSGQRVQLVLYNENGTVFDSVVTSAARSGSVSYDGSNLLIGQDEATDHWSGTIDEVRIYNRLLSRAEINTDMSTALQDPPIPPPSAIGQWSGIIPIPVVAVHMTLLATGDILFWDDKPNLVGANIWNLATNTFTNIPNSNGDAFCAGHAQLADGRLLIVGGDNGGNLGITNVSIYDPFAGTWSAVSPLNTPRWYPTATTLQDGRVIVTSGATTCGTCVADIPEIYDPVADTWTLLSNASLVIPLYPHQFLMPDGRLLVAASTEGAIPARALNIATQTWSVVNSTVVDGGSTAMYRLGKIIKCGTSTNSDPPVFPSAATTYVLDMNQPTPAWRQTASMKFPRAYHCLAVLPDGNVLVTGGGTTTASADLKDGVYTPELWSPSSETWTTMAPMQVPRLYHGGAVLLPDGRVLVSGGGRETGIGNPDPVDQLNAQIYSPPYLFKGPRPVITSAPGTIQYGTSFPVSTLDGARVLVQN